MKEMLRTDRAPAEPQTSGEQGPGGNGHRPLPRKPIPRRVRRRRILLLLLALLVVLTPVWWSLGSALGNRAYGTTVSARFAEWARDHGAAPVVVWAEKEWYSHHQPPKGGKPRSGAIPTASGPTKKSNAPKSTGPGLPAPARVVPPVSPALPNEGTWHPVGRTVDGVPAIYESFVRPDTVHTSLVVGIAWMDTKLLRATLYSGNQIPGGGPYTHTAPIKPTAATSLVAAFNAGFRMQDARGGYYTENKVVIPLRTGAARGPPPVDGSCQPRSSAATRCRSEPDKAARIGERRAPAPWGWRGGWAGWGGPGGAFCPRGRGGRWGGAAPVRSWSGIPRHRSLVLRNLLCDRPEPGKTVAT